MKILTTATTTERSIKAEALDVAGEYIGCRELGVQLQVKLHVGP